MGLLNKLLKAGNITASSVSEKVKTLPIETKIKKIEKTTPGEDNSEKINLKNKLQHIKDSEKEKRDKIAVQLKNDIKESKEKRAQEVKGLNPVKRLQKEFRELPVTSAADDLIFGISGLETMEKIIKQNPEDPYAWLLFAQTMKYHRKAFLTVQGLKLPVDFLGSIFDVGTEYVGDFVEKIVDEDKWTYERALKKAFSLVKAKECPSGVDNIIAGRCFHLLAEDIKDNEKKYVFFEEAEKYYKKSLESRLGNEDEGEVFYYLFEVCIKLKKFNEHIGYLQKSKDKGFVPAQKELNKYSIGKDISIPVVIKKADKFKYSIKKTAAEAAVSGTINVIENQGKKILKTGERIVDNVLDKLIK